MIKWIVENVVNSVWGFFADLALGIMESAFNLMTEAIIMQSDINKYLDINTYLSYVQIVAGALVVIAVLFQFIKQQSGIDDGEKSLGYLFSRTIGSIFLIYFLPKFVQDILLKANEAVMRLINSVGLKIEASTFQKLLFVADLKKGVEYLGGFTILLILMLAVGYLILSIAGGIRYIELIIAIIISPIAAVSVINGNEGLSTWFRETIAIVFTQSLHLFLLKLLMEIGLKVNGPMLIVLSIGVITVMLKGPTTLKTYLYRSGVGGGAAKTAGTAGRMVSMKYIFGSAKLGGK